jgi:hypothetical protein
MLSVKDQYSNEGTTKFTRVAIKPDLADSAVQIQAEEHNE